MINKSYKTSFPYPIPVYEAIVTYSEMQKPSGIAYILLELINNSSNIGGYFSEALKQSGIPNDLHHIFQKELKKLIEKKQVECEYDYATIDELGLDAFNVSDFKLTDLGKKMFRNRSIPTGENKQKPIEIACEDLIARRFSRVAPTWSDYEKSEFVRDGALYDKLHAYIQESDVQEHIERNKVNFGIKREEEILECEVRDSKWKTAVAKSKLTVTFDDNGVSFAPEGNADKKLFDDFYSLDTVIGIITAAPFFNFQQGTDMYEMEYSELNSEDVLLPGDLQKVMDGACSVYIARDNALYERSKTASAIAKITGSKAKSVLSVIGDDVLFARFMDSGECSFYVLCNAKVPCPQFSDDSLIPMALVAVYSADEEERRGLFDALYRIVFEKEMLPDAGKLMAYIEEHSEEHKGICKEYLDLKISEIDETEGKVEALCKLYDYVKACPSAMSVAKNIGEGLYEKYIADVTTDNLSLKYNVLSPLLGLTGKDVKNFVKDVCDVLRQGKYDDLSIFESLEGLKIKVDVILSQVNAVKPYTEMVLSNNSISSVNFGDRFETIRVNLWRLNDMFGVEDSKDYASPDDDIDQDKFMRQYSAFDEAYREVSGYRGFAEKEFTKIDKYLKRYSGVADRINFERSAQKSPENATPDYVDAFVRRGDIPNAVDELFVVLQYRLKKELKVGKSERIESQKLINNAFEAKLIGKTEQAKLHELRKCRNRFEHPSPDDGAIRIPTKEECEEWSDIVFSIGREDKK